MALSVSMQEGTSNDENPGDNNADGYWIVHGGEWSACRATKLQTMRRPAAGLHEELCWSDLQVGVPDVHEILRKEIVRPCTRRLAIVAGTAALVLIAFEASAMAAGNSRKLSGVQIRKKLAGMELTDGVHWRDVYDRDGTLRSYSDGTVKVGKWTIRKDELCVDFKESDDGCYEVLASGDRIEMKPSGLGLSIEGLVQQPADRN